MGAVRYTDAHKADNESGKNDSEESGISRKTSIIRLGIIGSPLHFSGMNWEFLLRTARDYGSGVVL